MVDLGQVRMFFEDEVWKVMEKRVNLQLAVLDREIENADPFLHGKAVGAREAYRLVLKMGEILTNESEGKSPYGNG